MRHLLWAGWCPVLVQEDTCTPSQGGSDDQPFDQGDGGCVGSLGLLRVVNIVQYCATMTNKLAKRLTMSLCKKDFIVNCTFVSGAGLVLVVVGWYRMRDTRLPGRKLEHVVGSEDSTCSSQLLRLAVCLHDLMDCIVAARMPPRTFDSRDVFRLRDG